MKKIFLMTVALISIVSAQVFGMYGVNSDWIDFLTHGNQFRARLEQLGFTLGNDTIKGTFGFDAPENYFGGIIKTKNGNNNVPTRLDLMPNISAGIGYTSSAISVGVGYSISIADQWRGVDGKAHQQAAHTPVLVLNALDNAFRMAIPIQVFHTTKLAQFGYGQTGDTTYSQTNSLTAVSLDAQFRYYTGLEALPQVRLYIKYGMASSQRKFANGDTTETYKNKFESFGFDFRLFFGSMVEDVALQPLFKVKYDTALDKYLGSKSITAVGLARNTVTGTVQSGSQATSTSAITALGNFGASKVYDENPYQLLILGGLGLTANSDIVSVLLRPELGLKINEDGYNSTKLDIGLGWNVYAELYITPVKNLEWYMEFSLGNDGASYDVNKANLVMNAGTGITWYLPAL